MRTLQPTLALVAMFALPMAIAEDRTPPKPGDNPVAAVSAGPRETRVIRLQHASAFRLFPELKSILSVEPAGPGSRLYVEYDAATNAIILSGPASDLQKAMELINLLDVAATNAARPTQLIRLRHSDAKELAWLMEHVIQQQAMGRARFEVPGVATDARTNTLLVTCEPGDYESIRKIIEALDVPVETAVARTEPQPTRARVTVYQVAVPAERAASLQAGDLSAAKDDAALTQHLEKLGATKLLYIMDQGIDLDRSPSMKIGSQRPIPSGSSTTKDGQRATSVSYQDVGCIVNMEGKWPADSPESGEADIEVEISHVMDSGVQIAPDAKAPVLFRVKQNFAGPFKSGRPIILLSLDAGGAKETTTAYVTRIELSRSAQEAART